MAAKHVVWPSVEVSNQDSTTEETLMMSPSWGNHQTTTKENPKSGCLKTPKNGTSERKREGERERRTNRARLQNGKCRIYPRGDLRLSGKPWTFHENELRDVIKWRFRAEYHPTKWWTIHSKKCRQFIHAFHCFPLFSINPLKSVQSVSYISH